MAKDDGVASAERQRLTTDRRRLDMAPRTLWGATSLNAIGLGLQVAFRALSLFILANSLGPAGQGEVALGYLVSTVGMTIASLGLDVALMRSAATEDLREATRATVWTHSVVVAAVAAIALAIVTAAATPLGVAFGVMAIPPLVFMRLAASSALAEQRDRSFAAGTVAPWAVNALGLAVLSGAGELTARRALAAFVAASAASAAFSALALASWLWPRWERRDRHEAYRTGLAIYPGMLAQLANYRLDQVVIAALLPRADLGIYSVAVAGSELGTLPAQATANALLPRESGANRRRRFRYAAMAVAAAAAVAVAIPFVIAIELALPRYERALVPFLVLLPGAVALAASKVLAATLTAWGAPWQASRVALLTLGLTIVGTSTLIPLFGLVGAAFASSFAYAASAALLLIAVRRLTDPPDPAATDLTPAMAPDRA